MTNLGRGLRVLAVVCVLGTLLGVTMLAGGAQDATPVAGTEQATHSTGTTQTSTTTPTTTESQGSAPTATPTSDTSTNTSGAGTHPESLVTAPNALSAAGTPAADTATVSDVDVTITAYLCPTTADTSNPGTSCTPGANIGFIVTNTGDNSTQKATTDKSGTATVSEPDGASLTIAVDSSTISSGYTLDGGTQSVTAAKGAGATFFFIAASTAAQGKIQVVNLSCPTTNATHTQWRIIEPGIMRAALAAPLTKCEPNVGASFTFTGGDLPASGLTVTTDDNGTWKGTLDTGTYTITEDATGSTNSITVKASGVSVAIATDFIHQTQVGTLDVKNFACPAAADSTQISVSAPGGANGTTPPANCKPADATFQLNSGNPFSVGSDGEISIPTVPQGSYTFTDVSSGQTAALDITTGETTSVVVLHYVAMGTVTVTDLSCADPVPTDQDTTDPSFWQQNCTTGSANAALALTDPSGNTAASGSTAGDGTLDFGFVPVGTYKVAGSGAELCAAFASGADASGGVAVKGGDSVAVTVYTCTRPSATGGTNGETGNNGGTTGETGGQNGTGDGTGGNETQQNASSQTTSSQTGTTGNTTVSQLPNTGAGALGGHGSEPLSLPIALLILGGAAVAVRRRQRAA